MTRTALAAAVLALLATVGVGAPVPKEIRNAKDDAKAILGEWKTVRSDYNNAEYNQSRDYLIFADKQLNWKTAVNGNDVAYTLALDPAKSPKEFDIELGPGRGHFLGIYKLDGDELTLACRLGTRPTEFTSNDATYHHKLTRVKK